MVPGRLSVVAVVGALFTAYWWLLIVRIILSWVPVRPKNELLANLVDLVHSLTDPYLDIFRKILPIADVGGVGIDFSPIIAFIVFQVVSGLVLDVLRQLGL